MLYRQLTYAAVALLRFVELLRENDQARSVFLETSDILLKNLHVKFIRVRALIQIKDNLNGFNRTINSAIVHSNADRFCLVFGQAGPFEFLKREATAKSLLLVITGNMKVMIRKK